MTTAPVLAKYRPRSVSAIGTARLLGGIVSVGLGLYLATSTTGYLNFMEETITDYESMTELTFVAAFVGGIFMILGLAAITIAFGTFKGKGWAWTANVILTPILIVLTILDIALGETSRATAASLVINGFILYYLFTRHVREYFGKIRPPSSFPSTFSITTNA